MHLTDSHIVIPNNDSKLLNAQFDGTKDGPALMQLWLHMSVVKVFTILLFTILRLEYDRYSLRPQLDAIKFKNPVFAINLPRCGSAFTSIGCSRRTRRRRS